LDAAENGIVAGAHRQALENPLSPAASHIADQPYDFVGALRLAGVQARCVGQTLTKDLCASTTGCGGENGLR
jgi:hypothetical protein